MVAQQAVALSPLCKSQKPAGTWGPEKWSLFFSLCRTSGYLILSFVPVHQTASLYRHFGWSHVNLHLHSSPLTLAYFLHSHFYLLLSPPYTYFFCLICLLSHSHYCTLFTLLSSPLWYPGTHWSSRGLKESGEEREKERRKWFWIRSREKFSVPIEWGPLRGIQDLSGLLRISFGEPLLSPGHGSCSKLVLHSVVALPECSHVRHNG